MTFLVATHPPKEKPPGRQAAGGLWFYRGSGQSLTTPAAFGPLSV